MRKLTSPSRGFSLVELAIVLLVVSILAAGAISMFRLQREHSVISETRSALDEAKEAIYAYAEVNGGLPCPDTDDDGVEQPNCETASPMIRRGRLPWRTLGLSRGEDAWGQPLRYVVSPNLGAKKLASLTTAGDVDIIEEDVTPLVHIVLTGSAAFSVRSAGPDGLDSSSAIASSEGKVITGSSATPSDDMVVWGSRFVLFGRILQAGHTLTLN